MCLCIALYVNVVVCECVYLFAPLICLCAYLSAHLNVCLCLLFGVVVFVVFVCSVSACVCRRKCLPAGL